MPLPSSPERPASVSAVIEATADRRRLRWRQIRALLVCAAVPLAGVALWWLVNTHQVMARDAADGLSGLGFLLTGGGLLADTWRRRRRRRGRLIWRPAVAGSSGVGPGLVVRRSIWPVVSSSLIFVPFAGISLVHGSTGLTDHQWDGAALLIPTALGVLAVTGEIYIRVRFTGLLSLTVDGVQQGRKLFRWDDIEGGRLHIDGSRTDGIELRLRQDLAGKRYPQVGGSRGVVSDERLLAAIELYRGQPLRLALELPVVPPEP